MPVQHRPHVTAEPPWELHSKLLAHIKDATRSPCVIPMLVPTLFATSSSKSLRSTQFQMARSRLYQNGRCLQKVHFASLFELYTWNLLFHRQTFRAGRCFASADAVHPGSDGSVVRFSSEGFSHFLSCRKNGIPQPSFFNRDPSKESEKEKKSGERCFPIVFEIGVDSTQRPDCM